MALTQAVPAGKDQLSMNEKTMANAIRALAMDAVEKAQSGHPGMPMGMADVATVLFTKFLKFDAKNPRWPDRDRFILSAGHGSMLIYALAYLTGYDNMTLDEIKNFRQLHSKTPGHPEVDPEIGVETTTGPLGQGISTAVGLALAERILNARFGSDLVDHHTYVIASDGDLMEGISHEACSLAGHLKLNRLIVLYDQNGISIDGSTDLSFTDDTPKRFDSYGWNTQSIDGHNETEIEKAIARAHKSDKPTIICCRTHIGYGAPTKQGKESSHGSPLGADEIAGARKNLTWAHGPFVIPDDVLKEWRKAGSRGASVYSAWQKRLDGASQKDAFRKTQKGDVSKDIAPIIAQIKESVAASKPKDATRKCSGNVLDKLVPALPDLIGGSADLTGSVNTKVKGPAAISASGYGGQYIHYGVREHGMAAIMNGMALHGGIIPYSGTFLSFSDYCRPSIRLAGLMKQRVIHVMTHDSIGLGEDGPTHQPVEHVAALRAIPNVHVFRPCDGIETAECWELALNNTKGPSILSLTRQGLPTLCDNRKDNASARGAYILRDSKQPVDVTLFATGSEVSIAVKACDELTQAGLACRVVSVPCMDLFYEQDAGYIALLTQSAGVKVAVEAGIRQGWDPIIGDNGLFIGMNSFGESAPSEVLYEYFGITAKAIVAKVKKKLEDNKRGS